MVSAIDKDLTTKDKTKETINPIKPRSEIGGKKDRPKKDETFPVNPKTKRKVLPTASTALTEDVKIPSFTPFIASG